MFGVGWACHLGVAECYAATDAELGMAEGDRRLVSGLLWVAPASNCIDCSCGIMQLLWLQWLWLQALCTHVQ
jgi:hypothetical protein